MSRTAFKAAGGSLGESRWVRFPCAPAIYMDHLTDRGQLVEALAAGHRPREEWALGLEFEQFVTGPDCLPRQYSGLGGVEELLRELGARTGWGLVCEEGRVLGLSAPDGRAVTLEPGAQLEFGSRPEKTLKALEIQLQEYCGHLKCLAEERSVRFLAVGAHPTASPEDMERIPKRRYDFLEPVLREASDLGLWMMRCTAGIQVNFDHADEEDAMRKLRMTFALSPVVCALFANSGVRAGSASGFASWRGHVWTRTDPARCGIPEPLVRPGAVFEDYVNWMLDVPMVFLRRAGVWVDPGGRSFREHFDSGEATAEDWDLHLSSPFPEARFRPQIELRCADTASPAMALALCALVKGWFYDDEALDNLERVVGEWSHAQIVEAWEAGHRSGLAAPGPGGKSLLEHARNVVSLARLNSLEDSWLNPIRHLLDEGRSRGELQADWAEEDIRKALKKLVDDAGCGRFAPSGNPF